MNIALSCFKYLLFLFNLVISLLGIAITAVAIWLRVDPDFFKMNGNFDIPDVNSIIYVAIVLGIVMVIIGFLGCWGAFQGNKCMLLSYVVIVTILLIVQIVIAALVLTAINDPEIQGKVNEFLSKQLKESKEKKEKSEFMDFIQAKLKCCGVEGSHDYDGHNIPPTCFDEGDEYYREGCSKKVINYIKKYATEIGGIVLGAFFVQLIAGVFAVFLYCGAIHSSSDVV